jgi:hypothetical protein
MNKFEKLLEERGVDYTLADSTTEFEDLANKLRTKMSLQKYIYGILGFVIFPLFSICNIYYLLVCNTELGKVMKLIIIASLLVISFLFSLLAIIEAKSLKSQYENRKYYKFDGRKISYYKFISLIYKDVSTFAAKFKNDGKDVIERRKSNIYIDNSSFEEADEWYAIVFYDKKTRLTSTPILITGCSKKSNKIRKVDTFAWTSSLYKTKNYQLVKEGRNMNFREVVVDDDTLHIGDNVFSVIDDMFVDNGEIVALECNNKFAVKFEAAGVKTLNKEVLFKDYNDCVQYQTKISEQKVKAIEATLPDDIEELIGYLSDIVSQELYSNHENIVYDAILEKRNGAGNKEISCYEKPCFDNYQVGDCVAFCHTNCLESPDKLRYGVIEETPFSSPETANRLYKIRTKGEDSVFIVPEDVFPNREAYIEYKENEIEQLKNSLPVNTVELLLWLASKADSFGSLYSMAVMRHLAKIKYANIDICLPSFRNDFLPSVSLLDAVSPNYKEKSINSSSKLEELKQIHNEIKLLREKERNILENVFPSFEELSDLYDIDNGSETGLTSNLLSEMFRFLRTPCTLYQIERLFQPVNFADSVLKDFENDKRFSAFTFSNSIGFVFRWDSKTISLLTHKFSDTFEPEKEKYRKEISFFATQLYKLIGNYKIDLYEIDTEKNKCIYHGRFVPTLEGFTIWKII